MKQGGQDFFWLYLDLMGDTGAIAIILWCCELTQFVSAWKKVGSIPKDSRKIQDDYRWDEGG